MRILGIDPGLQTTGFGVVDTEGARLKYVASGTISSGASTFAANERAPAHCSEPGASVHSSQVGSGASPVAAPSDPGVATAF